MHAYVYIGKLCRITCNIIIIHIYSMCNCIIHLSDNLYHLQGNFFDLQCNWKIKFYKVDATNVLI